MSRTRWRPLPQGELSAAQTLVFAGALGGVGLWLLFHFVNALTMWLTLATFVGYAIVYTVILKPATPQNIVIGGASGAMPPVLGWAAVTGEVTIEPMLLFLIIFAWTPPHFWSLALYRTEDYARAGVPMLPVTHGAQVHPLAGAALHADPVRGQPAALRDPHERPAVPGRSARAGRRIPRSTPCASTSPTATRWRRKPSATRSSTLLSFSRLFWSITICSLSSRAATAAPAVQEHRHHRRALRPGARAHRPHRQAAAAGGFSRQGGGAVLRLHPLPRYLSHHARRHRAGGQEPGPGRRARAGAAW